jgi:ABC-type arginine transport system ATPase subunit
MTRLALLARLQELQQMPKFQNRDIRTISAVLSNEALARHIKVCEAAIEAPSRTASATHNQAAGASRS